MYSCILNITVVSGCDRLREIIENAPTPEDCSVTISTVPALTEKINRLDSAVIFDGTERYNQGIEYVGEKTLAVLVTEASQLGAALGAVSRKPDDLWADSTAQFCAERLIAGMKQSFDFRIQTICFNTAFDSIPDLVWFKDVKGAHLIVNNGFCDAVAKTKEQIYKQGHYYIWDIPREEYEQGDYVCLESEEVVMKARETCLFDEKVKTKRGMRKFKTYKSPLIDENGEIFGTCGVANDVTVQQNINSELEVILDSMPFAVLIKDEKDDVIAANSLFTEYFPDFSGIVGTNISTWKNLVMRGKLDDSEVVVPTENGMIVLGCREKPITSIFGEQIGCVIILSDITESNRRQPPAAKNTDTDPLTGLFDRRKLESLAAEVKTANALAVVALDLDNLKRINEEFGTRLGDNALTDTAKLIKACFAEDVILRLGGDEFAVVVTRNASAEELSEQSEELILVLKEHFSDIEQLKGLSASAGISVCPEGADRNINKLIRQCENALAQAKSAGGGKAVVFSAV
ncbi:MAG: diguanylate cyclase domain-containing protein [Oscillospiraceae bacterium]